ncbi:hypothetical protein Tco_0953863 [Tanacetum coccineum]|uniref:Uncharacterized protein n=1 Tax=Tanacetum coccineum TaxID=301880 RepID=A0ABQ5E3D6_9ASTR
MEMKDTLSSCSDLDEQEIQQVQKQAKILKENSLNTFNALKTTTQRLERQTFTNCPLFQRAFSHLFHTDIRTFKYELSQNMNNLEKQLNNEILHEKDSKSSLSVIKVQFDKFIHSEMLKSSNYDSNARETRQDFKDYTQMEAQSFKDLIIQHMESIEQCIIERARHEQEIHNRLKRLNQRKLSIQECMVQKIKASDASLGEKDCSRIVSDKGNDQGLENQSNTSGDESSRSRNECNDKSTSGDDTNIRPSYDKEPIAKVPYTTEYNVFAIDTHHSEQPESISNTCVVEKVDSNVIPDSPDMCDNDIQTDQNFVKCDDKRVTLANLIANLKLDIDENKKIQKQLKKANASLTHELKECKSILAETSRTLGESNSIRDSCLIALQNKQTELETYKTLNDHTVDYEKFEHKLNETLGLLAQKEIDIKEGLKLKAYEILVVKEKHDELVKRSLLTKSHYEGLVKEKTKAKKKEQLQKDKALNTKPSVQQSDRLPNTTNGNKPKPRKFNQQPRNWPPSMSSRVLNRTVNIADAPRNQKTFLKSKDLACPTCKKCIYSANHDECILKYLSKVHSRASVLKKDAQSHKTTKRYMPVEKKCDSMKHDRQIPIGQKFSPNKSYVVYLKTTPLRSGLTWKPTGRIFTQVGLKWIPIRKLVESRYNMNDSASPLRKETHNPKTVICANSSSLSAGTSMASEPISSKGSSNVNILSTSSLYKRRCCSLISTESDSLPHAHTQATKTYYKHQDLRIKKAQELNTKTSVNSDIQDIPKSYQDYQGRLLASFQEDAKYEHVGQYTRSQDGRDNKTNKEKI